MQSQAHRRSPGRARSAEARLAILHATCELLAQDGYDKLAIERIAARAHVGKQTVYRWWHSKSEILAECLAEGLLLPLGSATASADDLRGGVQEWLDSIVDFLGEPGNVALFKGLIAASVDYPQLEQTLHERLSGPIQRAVTAWLDDSAAAGQLRPGLSVEPVIEMILGALMYRVMSGHRLDREYSAALLEIVLRGIAAPAPSAAGAGAASERRVTPE